MSRTKPCSQSGCSRGEYARGLCTRHYRQAKEEGKLGSPCSAAGCSKGAIARRLCSTHYMRLRPGSGFTARANRIELTCRGVENTYFKNGGHAINCKRTWRGTETLARGLVSREPDGTFVCHACWLWKCKLGKIEPSRVQLLLAGHKVPAPRDRQAVHELVARAHRERPGSGWGTKHTGRAPTAGSRRATTYDWRRMQPTTLVLVCQCERLHLLDTRQPAYLPPEMALHAGCPGVALTHRPDVLKSDFDYFVRRHLADEKLRPETKDGVAFVRAHLPEPDQVNPRYRNLVTTLASIADPNRRRPNAGPIQRSIRPTVGRR